MCKYFLCGTQMGVWERSRSSRKILFNEHHFRASFYVIWLEAPRHFWSAEHWIKLEISCSWCVKRPLIILVTEACSENSVSSALLLCSNLLKTVNSFGFDTERRKEQHVQVQTPPSFPTQKGKKQKAKKKKSKWQAHFEACEWEVVGDRLAQVSGIWSGSAVWNIFTWRVSCCCLQPRPTSHLLRNNSGLSQLTGGVSHPPSSGLTFLNEWMDIEMGY